MIIKHTINLTQRKFNITERIMGAIELAEKQSPRSLARHGFHLDLPNTETKDWAEYVIDQLIPGSEYTISFGPDFVRGKNNDVFMVIFLNTKYETEIFEDKIHDLDSIGIGRTPIEHLVSMGCFDIRDLDKFSDEQLLRIRGIGVKTLMRIRGYSEKADRVKHLLDRKLELEKELRIINSQINLLMEGN